MSGSGDTSRICCTVVTHRPLMSSHVRLEETEQRPGGDRRPWHWVQPVRYLGGSTPPTTGCAERLEYGNVLLNWGEMFLGPSFQPAQGRLISSQPAQPAQPGLGPDAKSRRRGVGDVSHPRPLAAIPNPARVRALSQPKVRRRQRMERRYAAARKERSADPHFHMVPSGRAVGERAAIR